MSEKVSTITLRLTADVVKEYPRFCAHYKQEAREHGELKRKYQEQGEAVRGFLSALDRLEKAGKEKERGK